MRPTLYAAGRAVVLLALVFAVTDPARAHGVLLESRPGAQETMMVASLRTW